MNEKGPLSQHGTFSGKHGGLTYYAKRGVVDLKSAVTGGKGGCAEALNRAAGRLRAFHAKVNTCDNSCLLPTNPVVNMATGYGTSITDEFMLRYERKHSQTCYVRS